MVYKLCRPAPWNMDVDELMTDSPLLFLLDDEIEFPAKTNSNADLYHPPSTFTAHAVKIPMSSS